MTLSTISVDGVSPRETLTPATADELGQALHAADEAGRAVAPIGGGTQLDFGMPPSRLDVAIETTGLNRVVEYEPADLTVTVEAGMRFAELQRILGEQGQFLALDPPVEPGATIGGVIATNASGPLRFAFGTPRDLVIGTRVANPNGTVTHAGGRVVKNVAGYDLNKLYIGSLGTLAVIVELSFKLAPIPPSLATVAGEFADSAAVSSLIGGVVRSPLSPLAIELNGSREVLFRVGGYPQAVERQVRELGERIRAADGQVVDRAWEELQRSRIEARKRDVIARAAAPISKSASVVEILERNLSGLDAVVWAHAGNGVAFAACNAPTDASALLAARKEVETLGDNATLVIERCPTRLKSAIDVWGDAGPGVAIMRAIKARLDPRNTLNPGRYVGGL